MDPLGKRKRTSQTVAQISTITGEGGDEDDEHDENDVRLSQRSVRSRTSAPSSAVVSETTRNNLRIRFRSRCWLCGLLGTDTAHVYPKADEVLFQRWKSLGVIQADSIHSLDNLLLLCGTCHRAYDRRVPAWTFLPTDMDALITQEEAFQHQRALAATQSHSLPRPSYTALPHLTYTRYLIRDEDPPHISPITVPRRRWMGDPALTIIGNASILGVPLPPAEVTAVLPKLNRLLELYRAEPPVLRRPSHSVAKVNDSSASGDGNSEGDDGGGDSRAPDDDFNDDAMDDDDVDELANDQFPGPKTRSVDHRTIPAKSHPYPKSKSKSAPITQPRRSKLTTLRKSPRKPKPNSQKAEQPITPPLKLRRTRRRYQLSPPARSHALEKPQETWSFGPSWTSQKISQYLGNVSD